MRREREEVREKVAELIAAILAALIAIFIASIVTFLLWNAIIPSLFGLPVITIWQALGLFILCDTLFKGNSPRVTGKND